MVACENKKLREEEFVRRKGIKDRRKRLVNKKDKARAEGTKICWRHRVT